MWPSAHQRVPRALQGRVRVPRALHGHEGRPTRLAPAPRALGARAMSDDEQTQLEAHAPVEGGAQLSHGPGTAAETGAAALAGAAEAVTDPPATLRARMIADLANFVPAGTRHPYRALCLGVVVPCAVRLLVVTRYLQLSKRINT